MTNRDELTVKLGLYIAENASTVRETANIFGIGKSTVHKIVTERLPLIDPILADRVRLVLDYNLSVRHLRGGEATRMKCLNKALGPRP